MTLASKCHSFDLDQSLCQERNTVLRPESVLLSLHLHSLIESTMMKGPQSGLAGFSIRSDQIRSNPHDVQEGVGGERASISPIQRKRSKCVELDMGTR